MQRFFQHDATLPPLTSEMIIDMMDAFYHIWVPEESNESPRAKAWRLFELNSFQMITVKELMMQYKSHVLNALRLWYACISFDPPLAGNENDDSLSRSRQFSSALESMRLYYDLASSEIRITRVANGFEDMCKGDEFHLFHFQFIDYSSNTEYQNLILFLLRLLYSRGYRRKDEDCWEEVVTPEGYRTRAWKRVGSIEQFVHQAVTKEQHYKMWQALTSCSKTVIKHLQVSFENEFPELVTGHHHRSFRNGIYNVLEMTFHPYATDPLPTSVVAVIYHNEVFDPALLQYESSLDIPTELDCVLDDQGLAADVKQVFWALFGTLMFKVNEIVKWQVGLFIKGVSNAGKSVIGKTAKRLYPASDVAVISSTYEKKFGAAALYTKKLIICFEVKRDFPIPQTDLQVYYSGDDASVAIKFANAVTVTWEVPLLLLGNENGPWADVNAMARRLAFIIFSNAIVNVDQMLEDRIFASMAPIIHKARLALHELKEQYGDAGFWQKCPQYFTDCQKAFKVDTNSLRAFIVNSDEIELRPDGGTMPLGVFKEMYVDWCKRSNERSHKFVPDFYEQVFREYGISKVRASQNWRGVVYDGVWLVGVQTKHQL